MDRPSTEAAFSTAPALTGRFGWIQPNRMGFAANPQMQACTGYTVRLGAAAKDTNGIALGTDFTFSFKTQCAPPRPPSVSSNFPANQATRVPLDTKIMVNFSTRMDRTSTEAAVGASPSTPWSAVWEASDMNLTLTPDLPLAAGTQYTITVTTAAKSTEGLQLPAMFAFSFTTVPAPPTPPVVIATTPADGSKDVKVDVKVSIVFSKGMDRTKTEDAISLSPAENLYFAWSSGGDVINISFGQNLQYSTNYTLKLATTAASDDGALLKEEFAATFATEKDPTGGGNGGGGGGGGGVGISSGTGIIIGAVVALAAIGALLAFLLLKKRRRAARADLPVALPPPPPDMASGSAPGGSSPEARRAAVARAARKKS
jgi:hypothetical protein